MGKKITRDDLMNMISSGEKFRLVDVSARDHFELEHIKGAISLPVDEIEGKALSVFNKDETIIVYCASFECQSSTNVALKLQQLGFENVLDYKGGLKDYKEANLPLGGNLIKAAVAKTREASEGC